MVSVLRSRERTPTWERARLKGIKRRRHVKWERKIDKMERRWMKHGGSEGSSEEERTGSSDEFDSSEEESVV